MNLLPTISLVVPIYNVEKYLRKCLDSLLAQTFSDIEIILVNDGSSDNSLGICEEYLQKDTRITLINKKNGGLSDARNVGLKIAKGDYIGFVDSDDWVEPNMYEVLYKLSIKENADISTCLLRVHSKDKKHVQYSPYVFKVFDSKNAIHSLYKGELSGFAAYNKLYRRSLFENIQFPIGRVYEDAAIMYILYNTANKIAFTNKPLYNYLRREGSITNSGFSEKRFDIIHNYYETYSFMEKNYPEMCTKINQQFYESLRNMIVDITNEGEMLKNKKYVLRVSKEIRKNNFKIIKNNSILFRHKLFVQVLGWCPWVGILMYKVKFKINELYQ